jgi:bifunctional non-homologous end joining protein LigD
VIHGKKLKGEFVLVKAHGRGENGWLLMKVEDKFTSQNDILLKDKSVISRMTLERVAATSTNIYGQKGGKSGNAKANAKVKMKNEKVKSEVVKVEKAAVRKLSAKTLALLKKGVTAPLPLSAKPMLATLTKSIPDEPGWIYEVKWDGYRALAMMHEGHVVLKSRNDKSFEKKFYPVFEAVSAWPVNAVVDGEIVVLNEHGVSHFSSLQNWRSEADGDLVFYVFDLLWYDGYDVSGLALSDRQLLLKAILPKDSLIRFSESFKTTGADFMTVAQKFGLEGIMAKQTDSPYRAGERSNEWLKIKLNKQQEVVIGGYTRNEDTKKPFSSLLVGMFEKGKLHYTGKIGTGFSQKVQQEMMEQFAPLIIKASPFAELPDINKPSRFRPNPPKAKATWLKPELVCKVSFAEMTEDGVMRHPAFEGMTSKSAKAVSKPKKAATVTATKGEQQKLAAEKVIVPLGRKPRATLLNPTEETQTRNVDGHPLKFTNLSKLYWPEDGLSKRDLINYYYQVAPYMLPYLKGRPMSLNRHPNGIKGPSFYQKDVTGKVPDWIDTMPYHSSDDPVERNFLLCQNEASLLYMASLGCIEINPWSSTVDTPDNPDWCILDLDPDKNSFDQVIEAAQMCKQVLDSCGVPSYCKTSGSTGLHIYIPLGAKYTYEQSKEFARVIVTMVHEQLPDFTSIERIVAKRKGKMYLDFLQNRPQATLAAPYSVRPKPGATVSMPLHWEEVKKGLKMKDFTIRNAMDRIRSEGDIFKKVLGKGIDLEKVIRKLG